MKVSKITLRAELQPLDSTARGADAVLELNQSFLVSGATRGTMSTHTIDLKDDSVIQLIYDDETTWFCSPDTLGEVYPELETQARSADGAFELPTILQSEDLERGVITSILLKAVTIFTKKKIKAKIKDLAADLERKQLENQSGLYRVDGNFSLRKFTASSASQPHLLFIHGTGSSSKGSFGELVGSDLWTYIQQIYKTNVLAFQHETLTKSALQNVAELVKQLPNNAVLHVISHSRGGLVGDVLSRFCTADNSRAGFTSDEIELLKKEGRDSDLAHIKEVTNLLTRKRIKVTKFVRVACPAQGTTLASRRLDTYLNVIFNLIGLGIGAGANPIYATFRNLIVAVIDSKNDVDVLPGLESMNPDSPFIKVLNNAKDPIELDDALMIVSGNCKMKLNLRALLIIVSKIFYQHKNDLVVDTESMYQGAKRAGAVQYFFDEGIDVDHFHYFKNKRTTDAIKLALSTPPAALVPTFAFRQTVASIERNALLKIEGGKVHQDKVTGAKPIVVLLPGIMGSNLSQANKTLWINYLQFIAGGLSRLDIGTKHIEATSLVGTSYGRLIRYLDSTYDVVTFPFDWRLSLNDSARIFNGKIKELLRHNQPIKIIGHSMGGVLVRDFISNHYLTWQQLNKTEGFKLLFLGAPLGGSYRIPAVLYGQDDIINKLAKIDITQTKKDLLNVFSRLPGLLNLLPHESVADFADRTVWASMNEAMGDKKWPIPGDSERQQFKSYRDSRKKIDELEEEDCRNMVYVAGQDKATPCGHRVDTLAGGKKELVFLSTAEGDQSVTWDSGIPQKLIDRKAVYYVNVTHGSLANEPSIFSGLADLLANGSTSLLSQTRPSVRSGAKVFRSPISSDFDFSPEGIERTLLGLAEGDRPRNETPLQLSVVNGDLKFASYPILAGHFWNDGILYAEKAIDKNLDGALQKRHSLGLYPGEVGTSEVLVSGSEDFKGVIIVGLGKPGDLSAHQLSKTVEQGASKYLISVNDPRVNNEHALPNGISALLIGCGYGGISIENAVRAIVHGVAQANRKIAELYGEEGKLIEYVEFVEQYLDRSLSCFHSICDLETDPSCNAVVYQKKILQRLGTRNRLPIDTSNEWWTRINVFLRNRKKDDHVIRTLRFNISTGGAREEQSDVHTAKEVIEQLVDEISTQNQWSPGLAKTIFELLIPNDFKERLKKLGNINWIVDPDTAAYPWELLQDSSANAEPLSIKAGMVRQLATQNYRKKIESVTHHNALVIADPNLKGFVGQLPGARKEGQQMANQLSANGFQVKPLLFSSASDIIKALFSNDYKIIHLAGHGVFNPDYSKGSGMVIGDHVYLSSREINQMSTVPELVFVNCCFLGKTDGFAEEYYANRYKLAANLGTQLVNNGVKAVVVAGWAVDDAAALEFAEEFYAQMFQGEAFGRAVQKARAKIYQTHKHTNTWGAYQCYGDPFYRLTPQDVGNNPDDYRFVIAEEAEVELFNLHSEIEMNNGEIEGFTKRLEAISLAIDEAKIRNATITEQEAIIYTDLFDYDAAINKYEQLLTLENASFTASALEKFCSLRAKQLIKAFTDNPEKRAAYLKKMNPVIDDLYSLLTLGGTAERLSLLGSTFKRKSILDKGSDKTNTYLQAALYFYRSSQVTDHTMPSYILCNFFLLSHLLVLKKKWQWGKTYVVQKISIHVPEQKAAVTTLNHLKSQLPAEKMDYWDLISHANIALTRYILNGAKDGEVSALVGIYKKAWNKYGSRGKKMAEMEHITFLLDALQTIPSSKAVCRSVERLKSALEKMI